MVITQEYEDVPVADRAMRTFVAAPRDAGPHPGVVFYSDIFQLTPSTLRFCARLAGHGFVVAAPEIYHRIEPPGTVLEFDDEGKVRGQADAERTPVADFDEDIGAALDFLEADDRVAAGGSPRPATARAGTSASARRSTRACAPPRLVPDRAARRRARRRRRCRLAGARRRDRRRAAADLRLA